MTRPADPGRMLPGERESAAISKRIVCRIPVIPALVFMVLQITGIEYLMRTGIEITFSLALHLLHIAPAERLQPEPAPAAPEHLKVDNNPATRLDRGQLRVHGFHVQAGVGRFRFLGMIML